MIRVASQLLLLTVVLPGPTPPPGNQDDSIPAAHEALVKEVEDYAAWCATERLSLERARILELLLEIEPDHADARRVHGYTKDRKTGEWVPPKKPKRYTDKNKKALEEAPAVLAAGMARYMEVLLPILTDPEVPPDVVRRLEDEVLLIEPGNEIVRARRGEVAQGDAWRLEETLTAGRNRAELAEVAGSLMAQPPEVGESKTTEEEHSLAPMASLLVPPELRVLAPAGREAAERAARAMSAALLLFEELLGKEASYPYQGTLYLLATDADKEAFLSRHPKMTPEIRKQIERLDGAGIPGTGDWAIWVDDPAKRIDLAVRMSFDWTFREGLGVSFEHGWAHEGVGMYMTWLLLGTRLSFFAPDDIDPVTAYASRNRLLDPTTDWMLEASSVAAGMRGEDLEHLMGKGVGELTSDDLLLSYGLAAYLLEAWPDRTPGILAGIGAGGEPGPVLEKALEQDLDGLSARFARWLDERRLQPDVVSSQLEDEQLVEAWSSLDPKRKKQVVSLFEERLAALETSQLRTIRTLLDSSRREYPEPGELDYYDPKVHAPRDPIPRRRLDPEDGLARVVWRQAFGDPDPRDLVESYRYEWGRGIQRIGDPDDPETIFANAIRGYPPGIDLARAIALSELDLGPHEKLMVAFAHAYTDRDGNVYPGVTLFDAWQSEEIIEMPDVDVLGIVHDVLGEYDRWVAPIPDEQHDPLYAEIEELFVKVQQYRKVREILAGTYLMANPIWPPGFESMHTNLHALWAVEGDDVSKMAAKLPEEDWVPFVNEWVDRCKADSGLWTRGWKREIQLKQDAEAVRGALVSALDEAGAISSPAGSGDGR